MPDAPSPRHSVSVAAAIFDDSGQNVLLIKRRDNGQWESPGGVLELHESLEDGLRREVREETGAEVEIVSLTGVYKHMTLGVVALVFRARLRTPAATKSPEAEKVAWVPVSMVNDIMRPVHAVRIQDALSQGVALREHDGVRLLCDPSGIGPQKTNSR